MTDEKKPRLISATRSADEIYRNVYPMIFPLDGVKYNRLVELAEQNWDDGYAYALQDRDHLREELNLLKHAADAEAGEADRLRESLKLAADVLQKYVNMDNGRDCSYGLHAELVLARLRERHPSLEKKIETMAIEVQDYRGIQNAESIDELRRQGKL